MVYPRNIPNQNELILWVYQDFISSIFHTPISYPIGCISHYVYPLVN